MNEPQLLNVDEQTPTEQLLMELASWDETLAALHIQRWQIQQEIQTCQERMNRIHELLDRRQYGLDGMTPLTA